MLRTACLALILLPLGLSAAAPAAAQTRSPAASAAGAPGTPAYPPLSPSTPYPPPARPGAGASSGLDNPDLGLGLPGDPALGGRRRQPTQFDTQSGAGAAPTGRTPVTRPRGAANPAQMETDRLYEEIMRRSAPPEQR